jgi:hypothetical protein
VAGGEWPGSPMEFKSITADFAGKGITKSKLGKNQNSMTGQ